MCYKKDNLHSHLIIYKILLKIYKCLRSILIIRDGIQMKWRVCYLLWEIHNVAIVWIFILNCLVTCICYLHFISVVGQSDIYDWVQIEKDNKRE